MKNQSKKITLTFIWIGLIIFILGVAKASDIAQNTQAIIKSYVIDITASVTQNAAQSVKFWFYMTEKGFPGEQCKRLKCYIGWIGKTQSISAGVQQDFKHGFPGILNQSPLFTFQADSVNDYEVQVSQLIDEGIKDLIFLGIQQTNPFKGVFKHLLTQQKSLDEECKQAVANSALSQSKIQCSSTKKVNNDGELLQEKQTLSLAFSNSSEYLANQFASDRNQPLPQIKAYVGINAKKLDDVLNTTLVDLAIKTLKSFSDLTTFNQQAIGQRNKKKASDQLILEYSIQPEVLKQDTRTRNLGQISSMKFLIDKIHKVYAEKLFGRENSVTYNVKCSLLTFDDNSKLVSCIGKAFLIVLGKEKNVTIFDKKISLKTETDLDTIKGSFAFNMPIQIPKTLGIVSLNVNAKIDYDIATNIAMVPSRVKKNEYDLIISMKGTASTNSKLQIDVSRVYKLGYQFQGTVFEITAYPSLNLILPTVEEPKTCINLDWDQQSVSFIGTFKAFYKKTRGTRRIRRPWGKQHKITDFEGKGLRKKLKLERFSKCLQKDE